MGQSPDVTEEELDHFRNKQGELSLRRHCLQLDRELRWYTASLGGRLSPRPGGLESLWSTNMRARDTYTVTLFPIKRGYENPYFHGAEYRGTSRPEGYSKAGRPCGLRATRNRECLGNGRSPVGTEKPEALA